MKEYIAETGGRYTYSDDILNLQELALSMSAVFDGCSDFIISGCEIEGPRVSPGYVWLGGKVRRFDGCADAVYPYYIYEINRHESVVYANEVNKRGRTCYLCAGAKAVPDTVDPVTDKLPAAIEVTESYAPRFIDKFFGRYAVLLDTPLPGRPSRRIWCWPERSPGRKKSAPRPPSPSAAGTATFSKAS